MAGLNGKGVLLLPMANMPNRFIGSVSRCLARIPKGQPVTRGQTGSENKQATVDYSEGREGTVKMTRLMVSCFLMGSRDALHMIGR